MKKLLCILLIVALFLPSAVLADETDPIVGCWYVYSGFVDNSDIYFEFHTFVFTFDGNVFSTKYDISEDGTTSAKDYHVIGLWTKEDGKYYINIGLEGAEELIVDNDTIFFPVTDSMKLRIRKMTPLNSVLDARS